MKKQKVHFNGIEAFFSCSGAGIAFSSVSQKLGMKFSTPGQKYAAQKPDAGRVPAAARPPELNTFQAFTCCSWLLISAMSF
jgi:hypothetical protein